MSLMRKFFLTEKRIASFVEKNPCKDAVQKKKSSTDYKVGLPQEYNTLEAIFGERILLETQNIVLNQVIYDKC